VIYGATVTEPLQEESTMHRLSQISRAPSTVGTACIAGAVLLVGVVLVLSRSQVPGEHAALHGGEAYTMASNRPAGITAKTVSEETLAHVPGKKVIVEVVEFPPGASVPEHHHGGSVTVYVLSGTIRSQLDSGPVLDYAAEETFFEAPGTIHTLTANPSATERARFMAIHVIDEGAELTTYH
jgi:quercetin dioxygenase-like cupin family protein